jgi:amino acid adenylation domain-containing protein
MSPEPGSAIPIRPRSRRPDDGLAEAKRALLDLRNRRMAAADEGIQPVPGDGPLVLSFAQQRLWFLDQLVHGRPVYNSPMALRIRGPLDRAAIESALRAVVARHETLRTRFQAERGVPYQVIDPPPERIDIPLLDLTMSGAPEPERERRARREMADLGRTVIDLSTGPLLAARLVKIADDDHMLGLCVHHIATDGWSGAILIRELAACYRAVRLETSSELAPLPVRYADYAAWERRRDSGDAVRRQLGYWRQQLSGLPALDLLTEYQRPAERTFSGQTLTCDLPEQLRADLNELARAHQGTLLTVVLAGFTALLTRYTGQDDIVVGSIFSGRSVPEIEGLIGFFANTLVLRTSTAGDPTFTELLTRTRQTVTGAHLNADVGFDRLVGELSPERDPGRNPLFQVSFTLQHAAERAGSLDGLDITSELVDVGTARFDLAVHLTEIPGSGLELWMEFSTELFDPRRMRRLPGHFARVLAQMAANPSARISEIAIMSPEEEKHALDRSTAPVRYPDAERCLHELFTRAASAWPGKAACRFSGGELTYAELDARSSRLAHLLRAVHGVGPETVVGVLLDRGLELPASLLGILKAGGAYLPLDPLHPRERVRFTLTDAAARIVITTRHLAGLLPDDVLALPLDDPATAAAIADQPASTPACPTTPANAAYLIYTSGSTGAPKGVIVEHRQIVNFTLAVTDMFGLGPDDRVLQFANPAFDTSAFDFYGSLTNGGTLIQAPTTTLYDPVSLATLMREEGVTVTDLPPTVLARLDPVDVPELRALFVGMEPFPVELVNRWTSAGRAFHNGYGPTEATVACIDYLCPPETLHGLPPIGTPMANYTAYVLDRSGTVVPSGVVGELYAGGTGVARGYHGRPGLTADRFVPSPFGPPGARLYRTGDLASRDEDGILTFRGRADHQIKINGLRTEPKEIEARLLEHPAIQQALVIADGEGAAARLLAYLIPGGADQPETGELRRHLAERLPLFMVPARFAYLDGFPKDANGKIDRSRLPRPEVPGAAAPVAPGTPAERKLAQIWCEVLGVPEVSAGDDFFSLGGNSLKFAQIATHISEAFGTTVDLRSLLVYPTLRDLAGYITAEQPARGPEEEA